MVNELHLLEDGGLCGWTCQSDSKAAGQVMMDTNLARLASSQKKHLDLVLRHHTVTLELVLNLIVACGRMMVRERNATEEQYENSRHRAHGRSGGERTAWSQ